MVSGRPAGFSSEEGSDDELSFSFDSPLSKLNKNLKGKKVELLNGEKLVNAIMDKDLNEVKKFLDSGTDVQFKSKKTGGWTPIMHACSVGSKDILQQLLLYGANPNDHHEMFTALMCVCDSSSKDENQLLDCFNILIDHEANVNAVDWYKTTPLMMAVKRNHSNLVLRLIEMGCNLEQVDSDGWSAIFYAVDSGNIHMVQLLKDAKADLSREDRRGRTLHEIATSKYLKDIAEIVNLKDKNIDIDEKIEHTRSYKRLSHYQYMLTECPDITKGRLHGFSNEALRIINGIGLGHLNTIFAEKNIQLAQLLTWNDDEWKKVSVEMSFDRQKIKASVQKFHEHNWGKQSLKMVDENEIVDLFTVAQILSNLVRQFHIMSATTHFYLKHRKTVKTSSDLNLFNDKGLYHLNFIRKELELINDLALQIDLEENIVPADLIESKKIERTSNMKFVLYSALLGVFVYNWKSIHHLSSNLFFSSHSLITKFKIKFNNDWF